MPKAFSITYGLDLETEVESFWAWLRGAHEVMTGTGQASKQVRDLVESQRQQIEEFAAGTPNPEWTRFALTLALASVGFHYASHQKLLKGLEEYGILKQVAGWPPVFDTIIEPPLEGPEPPR